MTRFSLLSSTRHCGLSMLPRNQQGVGRSRRHGGRGRATNGSFLFAEPPQFPDDALRRGGIVAAFADAFRQKDENENAGGHEKEKPRIIRNGAQLPELQIHAEKFEFHEASLSCR